MRLFYGGHGTAWVSQQGLPWALPRQRQVVLGPVVPADTPPPVVFQVNEIYHDESLGAHINVVLVRIILLSYGKVSEPVSSQRCRAPVRCGMKGALQCGTGLL